MKNEVRILTDAEVCRGGWYYGKWLTKRLIKEAENRWVERSIRSGESESDVRVYSRYNWIPHQCGACKYFASFGDYGICWCKESLLDGCITFEHGGCTKHSNYEEEVAKLP